MIGVFHAFGQRANPQALTERGDRSHHGPVLKIVTGQRAIDFDFVEREVGELTQGRSTRSEFIHSDSDVHGAKMIQRCDHVAIVMEEKVFGQLDLESLARQSSAAESASDGIREVRSIELQRRSLHRNYQLIRPAHRLAASGTQGPIEDRHNDADFFSDRQKSFRG